MEVAARSLPTAGLTAAAAAERLRIDGPNELPVPPRPSAMRMVIGELTHFLALLLWGAAVLAAVAGMPELAVAIAVVVIVNEVLGQQPPAAAALAVAVLVIPAIVAVDHIDKWLAGRVRRPPAGSSTSGFGTDGPT